MNIHRDFCYKGESLVFAGHEPDDEEEEEEEETFEDALKPVEQKLYWQMGFDSREDEVAGFRSELAESVVREMELQDRIRNLEKELSDTKSGVKYAIQQLQSLG